MAPFTVLLLTQLLLPFTQADCSSSTAFRLLADDTDMMNPQTAFPVTRAAPRLTFATPATQDNAMEAFQIEVIDVATGKAWNSGIVNSTWPSYRFDKYSTPLKGGRTYEWAVSTRTSDGCWTTSRSARFHVSLLDVTDWNDVAWIGSLSGENVYRSTFKTEAGKKISSATLYVCGLGYSALSVNGKVIDDVLLATSPWSRTDKRNGFATVDITPMLSKSGDTNAIGVMLGHGWRDLSKFPPKDHQSKIDTTPERVLRAQVRIIYSDAPKDAVVATKTGDGSWTSAVGPVTSDSVYDGESYDARKVAKGWDTASFADYSLFHAATKVGHPPDCFVLTACLNESNAPMSIHSLTPDHVPISSSGPRPPRPDVPLGRTVRASVQDCVACQHHIAGGEPPRCGFRQQPRGGGEARWREVQVRRHHNVAPRRDFAARGHPRAQGRGPQARVLRQPAQR